MKKEITISKPKVGERLDIFLANFFPEYSRNYFSVLIRNGDVKVSNQAQKPSYKLKCSDNISIDFKEIETKKELVPSQLKLDIIYEDQNVIAINKQAGIVVHPAAGNYENTLVNALVNYFPEIKKAVYDKSSQISRLRPGLVHRLDKDTSGVIIIAKNVRSMHSLSRQIQNRTVKKIYWALCYGWPKEVSGTLINYLGRHLKNRKHIADIGKEKGKEAISQYKVVNFLKNEKGDKASLIEFNIKTGRTHQIRVQSSRIGHPVLGDDFYGNKNSDLLSKNLNINRQMLHARTLEITLPGDNKATKFEAPLPEDFRNILDSLKSV